MDIEGVGG